MVRTIPKKLDGGRTALYRGKDAYASQTFENDTRAQNLTALLVAYLPAGGTITASVDNEIAFTSFQSAYIKTPVLRSIQRVLNSLSRFVIQKNCTARLSYRAEILALAATQLMDMKINILRGSTLIVLEDRQTNTDATNAGTFGASSSWILDLNQSDIVYLTVNPGTANATINGFNGVGAGNFVLDGTRLMIEELT